MRYVRDAVLSVAALAAGGAATAAATVTYTQAPAGNRTRVQVTGASQ